MSAYLVSKPTIDLLVSAALEWKLHIKSADYPGYAQVTESAAEELGRTLLRENVKSLCYRYADDTAAAYEADIAGYAFQKYVGIKPAGIVGLARCYDYQACEHPEYQSSDAKDLINGLFKKCAELLAVGKDTPWGVDSVEDASKIGRPVRW